MGHEPIRIAVIGVGRHAREILIPALQLSPTFRIVALATARAETAASARARFCYPAVVGHESILADPDVDAVLIATPSATHVELTVNALRAGKHVFCETPGVRSAEDVQTVQRALDPSGRVLAYGTCLRYAPIYQKLRSLLPGLKRPDGLVLSLRYYSYLRHTFDLALYLMSDVERVTCSRRGKQSLTTLEFASGDLGIVHGGGPDCPGVPIEQVEVSSAAGIVSARGARELWSFPGDGTDSIDDLTFDSVPATVWSPTGSIPYRSLSNLTMRGYLPELEHFAEAIRTGGPTLSGLDQAERTLRLERAVATSVEEHRPVALEASLLA